MSELGTYIHQRLEALSGNVKWDEIRDEWLEAVQRLNGQIKEWLADEVAQGLVTIEEYDVARDEERMGSYVATALRLKTPIGVVQIEPVARVIIGGLGRVDMSSLRGGSYMLVRLAVSGWVYMPETRGDWQPLTQHVFTDLIKKLLQ